MATSRRRYHHGALREQIIAASLAMIEESGLEALSLREVARRAGVSSGAPYHHFPDRAALLAAIALDGYAAMARRMRQAATDAAADPAAALGAVVRAYVTFAAANPGVLRVLHNTHLADPAAHPEIHREGAAAVGVLESVVDACVGAGLVPRSHAEALLHLCWSAAVGFVGLWLDGPLDVRCVALGTSPAEMADEVASLVTDLLRSGGWHRPPQI